MNIPRIVRGNPDRAFVSFRNVNGTAGTEAAAALAGEVYQWALHSEYTEAPTGVFKFNGHLQTLGVDAKRSTGAVNHPAGVVVNPGGRKADGTPCVMPGQYGLLQTYGVCSDVKATAAAPAEAAIFTADAAGAVVVGVAVPSTYVGTSLKVGAGNKVTLFLRLM